MQMRMQFLISSLISFEVDVRNVNLISRILNLLRQAGDPHLIGNLLHVIFILNGRIFNEYNTLYISSVRQEG